METTSDYQTIYYKDLILDPQNPRLPRSKHNLDERGIIDYMLLEAATLELMQAIGENDFFKGEQLLVVHEGNKYKVLEGNRRLTAIKLLNEPELASVKKASVREIYEAAQHRPTHIPCLIFNTEDEIRRYLGYRHITGIKPWGLTEKSRYLYKLYFDEFKGENIDNADNNKLFLCILSIYDEFILKLDKSLTDYIIRRTNQNNNFYTTSMNEYDVFVKFNKKFNKNKE